MEPVRTSGKTGFPTASLTPGLQQDSTTGHQFAIFPTELSAGTARSLEMPETSAPRVKGGEVPVSVLSDITLLSGQDSQ